MKRFFGIAVALAISATSTARADVVYTYTGADYTYWTAFHPGIIPFTLPFTGSDLNSWSHNLGPRLTLSITVPSQPNGESVL